MQYENRISFIYIKTFKNIDLDETKLGELCEYGFCYYKKPTETDLI